ncbi:kinase-like domain-containing protein [Apiosordaria backusii]|uniref:Kinase-like domain-containing protein n=1 Tax=Apiosordaria backusii TaxID=314023 RepID=A0AA40BSF5_9PEZI|nr:kinase-like domain-containing protein [Apiosordaria backusii]
MVNILEYTIGVAAEDLGKYCPGGYHPIHLHDTLQNDRYEILHKLGFGAFSTVWLARDNLKQRNVTIKVVTADKSDETSRELSVLQALKDRGDPDHPGHKHVSHLLESFHIEGPNGRHLCAVLDLLGPTTSSVADRCPNYRLEGNLARSVSRQLLLAVDYLHSVGVAHGDIHMGNVQFCLPDLKPASPESIIQHLGPPQVGKIARRDGRPLEPGIPEYLVEPTEFSPKIYPRLREIKLIDLGESFFFAQPPTQISTPMSHHPPELVFQRVLSKAVDIWNLGSTTYELVTGRTPFEADFDDKDLIPQFQKVIGGIPEQWIHDALASGVLKNPPSNSSADYFLPLEEEIRRSYFDGYESKTLQLDEAELETLGQYLRKLLVVDPDQRASTRELLNDPWVSREEPN